MLFDDLQPSLSHALYCMIASAGIVFYVFRNLADVSKLEFKELIR
jgi:hypothetical protein